MDRQGIDWQSFAKSLSVENSPKIVRDRINYAKRFGNCLLSKNLSDLRLLSDDTRLHAMKALASLSKFLGVYEDWQKLVRNHGLKWTAKSNDDIIIGRLTKTTDVNEMFVWIKSVKELCPELNDFVDFMAISGMRLREAIASYNLIIMLNKERALSQYYNSKKEILEHFRFREIFLRRTKKVFVSFMPSEIVQKVSKKILLTEDSIRCKIKRRKLPSRFSDLRELHGTLATKHLSQVEVDFLHGRISKSVFMANYFNINLVDDLKARVFKVIKELRKGIS
jgi:hypothetical protein